ncbi:polysaccharide deacetylase family protein [Yinghuangia soli]|uniref:Polysaccharide deacetylase family protein n=1 Tax=Yinghuangia soli TaxID=2908204 RepID=A0AA41Q134_9ACTN|nr:polysaccharide deacetylase family protein [Yinghuangia soli]MCF2529267.1 polysaccharide deacetylase family protein [Yinghuangia soli]
MNPAVRARLASWYARADAWPGADAALRRSPLQAYLRRRSADRLAVLGYHGIDDAEGFAAQMDHLQAHAFPVSLRQVEDAVHNGRRLPPYSVLVTFDDGDVSVATEGLPLLAARGIPAVCFVVAGLIGTDTPFWWDEAEYLARHGGRSRRLPEVAPEIVPHPMKLLTENERRSVLEELRETATAQAPRRPQLTPEQLVQLRDGGVEIGSHTLTHPCLDRCDDRQVEEEILGAHDRLAGLLGSAPTSFAYPNGNTDARAHRLLDKCGYRTAFLYNHSLARPGSCSPLGIDRLVVTPAAGPDRFATVLSGLHPAVFRVGRTVARSAARAVQPFARSS